MRLQNWSEISEFFIFKKITAVLGLPCDIRSTNWATLLLYMQDGMGSNTALTNKSAICWEVFLQVLEICGACAIIFILEKALWALASSFGGVACLGATRGQPGGSTPGVRGWFQEDLSEKKNCDGRTKDEGRTDGRTDVKVEIVV